MSSRSLTNLLPPGFLFNLSTLAMPYIGSTAVYALAQIGTGVGPEVYASIPAEMKKAPATTKDAYAQAFYFTALATQRALMLQDQGEVEAEVPQQFFRFLTSLNTDLAIIQQGVGTACEYAGAICPVRSAGRVLKDTITMITNSGLPEDDVIALTTPLRKNRSQVVMRQAVPYVLLFAVGGFFVHSYYQQNKIRSLRSTSV